MSYSWGPDPTRDPCARTIQRADGYGVSWIDDLFAPWRDAGLHARIERAVLHDIPHLIRTLGEDMAAREDQAYADLTATIQTVKDGWASLTAERDALKTALENADASAAAQVQAALDADSDVDAGKVEAADAALAELVAPAPSPEPTPEPAPADPTV